MKRFGIRILSVSVLLVLCCCLLPWTNLMPWASSALGASSSVIIPSVFSLKESELDAECSSGQWRYALRTEDRYAIVTGFDGDPANVVVPIQLDGNEVAGIGANALTDAHSVTLHSNILYIHEQAFGTSRPHICSPNGSYGLYYAFTHNLTYTTGKEYDLKPEVIDLSDLPEGRVRRRGEDHVVLDKLTAMRVEIGSLIWFPDSRGLDYFCRIIGLSTVGDTSIAEVETPELADVIINYATTQDIVLTADDFVPADGVIVERGSPSGKTVTQLDETKTTTLKKDFEFGKVKFGNGESSNFKGIASVSVVAAAKVQYTIEILNGQTTKSEMTKIQSYDVSLSIGCKGFEDRQKEYANTISNVIKEKENGGVTDSTASKVSQLLSNGWKLSTNESETGCSKEEIEESIGDYVKALIEIRDSHKPVMSWDAELGSFKLQTPYFNLSADIDVEYNISGDLTYTYSVSDITKEVYNFSTDEWEVVYSNGNTTSSSSEHSLKIDIKGNFCVRVEISAGFLFVKNLSAQFEFGIDAKATKKFSSNQAFPYPCTELALEPYISLKAYVGAWVGKSTGFKHKIWDKRISYQEMTGCLYLFQIHLNFGCSEVFHFPDRCPLNDVCTVFYDTKTSKQVQSKQIARGAYLNSDYNVWLNDDPDCGEFLGWALNPTDTEPTAVFLAQFSYYAIGPDYPHVVHVDPSSNTPEARSLTRVDGNLTLYAVWSNQFDVHFDSAGGSYIADQKVPSGGYIVPPSNPVKNNAHFIAWVDKNADVWDFERNTVNKNITLYAIWDDSTPSNGGTTRGTFWGDYESIDRNLIKTEGQKEVVYHEALARFTYQYEIFTPDGTDAHGVRITGFNGNPEYIYVPDELRIINLSINGVVLSEDRLPVCDVDQNAFQGHTNLRAVSFGLSDRTQLSTTGLFKNCTNLEYVEMPYLAHGKLDYECFSGCTNLKCVVMKPGLVSIGSRAFAGSGLTMLSIPKGLDNIESYAFANCQQLTEVFYGGANLTTVSPYTFYNCTALESLMLCDGYHHSTLTTISHGAFYGCSSLTSLYIPDSVRTLEVTRSRLPDSSSSDSHYISPFYYCTGLKTISVGGVESLESDMLRTGSTNLEKLIIRGSVKKIANNAFNSSVSFDYGYSTIANGYNFDVSHPVELIIEEGVESIGYQAFRNCTMFTSASIPQSVTSIGSYAFYECTNMKASLRLPNLSTIESCAFYNCPQLTDVSLPRVSSIGALAFGCCTGLSSLDLGTVVSDISYGAFYRCTSLTSLYIPDSVRTLGVARHYLTDVKSEYYIGPFCYCTGLKTISVGGVESLENNMLRTGSTNLEQLTIRGSVKNIANNAFNSSSPFGYDYSDSRNGYSFSVSHPVELVIEEGVESIGNHAFYGCTMFTSASIPQSVTSIGNRAFYGCTNMKASLTLTQLTAVGDYAFYNCQRLAYLDLSHASLIGAYSFYNCNQLTTVNLPRVSDIGSYAFGCCSSLVSLDLGSVVSTISYGAFYRCTSLTSLYIPDSVRTLGVTKARLPDLLSSDTHFIGPFYNCTGLKTISVGGVETLKPNMLSTGSTNLEKLIIRGSVKAIAPNAFSSSTPFPYNFPSETANGYHYSVSHPVELVIEDGVESIDDYAFFCCSMFTSASIPQSVTSIGNRAFYGCTNMKASLTLTQLTAVGDYAFYNCQRLAYLDLSRASLIGAYSFYNCNQLTTANLPRVSDIGSYAFGCCTSLVSLDLGSVVSTISYGAFYRCTSLTSLYIPDSVRTLGVTKARLPDLLSSDTHFIGPFYNCTGLKTISVGGVETLKPNMLSTGSTNLEKLIIRGSVKAIAPNAFSSSTPFPYNFPSESANGYHYSVSHPVELVIEDGVESIGEGAFYYCSMFTSASIPQSVTSIGNRAFYGCTNMKASLTLTQLTAVGDYTFYNCQQLTGISLPHVSDIGPYAFGCCTSLVSLDLGSVVSTISHGAFYRCSSLTSLYIPDSVKTLGVAKTYLPDLNGSYQYYIGPFFRCSGLKTISVGGVETLQSDMLSTGSKMLEKLTIRGSVKTIANYAFRSTLNFPHESSQSANGYNDLNVSHPVELVIEDGVESIGEGAFYYCSMFTSASIPQSVKSIGNRAFYGCNRLTDARFLAGDITPGANAFANCTLLTIHLAENSSAMQAYCTANFLPCDFAEALPHSLTLHAQQGYVEGLTDLITSLNWQEALDLPNPVRDGYLFAGWYLDSSATILCMLDTMPACDLELWAGWISLENYLPPDHLRLTLISSDGLFSNGQHQLFLQPVCGSPLSEIERPIWDQHIFSGWYLDEALSQPYTHSVLGLSDMTLYASWDQDIFSLTLDARGGEGAQAESLFHAGDQVHIQSPAMAGSLFLGWYLDPDCTERFSGIMPAADLTLYADWLPVSQGGRYQIENGSASLVSYILLEEERPLICLPSSVDGVPLTGIAPGAFSNCDALEIWLPETIDNIAPDAFVGCDNLKAIHVVSDNPVFSSSDGIVYSHDGTVLYIYPCDHGRHLAIPEGVTVIGDRAFESTHLSSVTLPVSLERIGSHAFSKTNIMQLKLYDNVIEIGERAFDGCRNLSLVQASCSPEQIGDYAFSGLNAFALFYGPDEPCILRSVTQASGFRYNAHTLTVHMPSQDMSAFLDSGAALTLPSSFDLPENTLFTGWFINESLSEPFGGAIMPNEDLTLWAGIIQRFSFESYTLTRNTETVRLLSCAESGDVVIPDTLAGNTVVSVADGCFDETVTTIFVPASILEIGDNAIAPGTVVYYIAGSYAESWAVEHGFARNEQQFSVRFEAGNSIPLPSWSGVAGSDFSLPEVSRNGYDLLGWYWDEAFSEPVTSAIVPSYDAVLYAAWTLTDETVALTAESLSWTLIDDHVIITGLSRAIDTLIIPDQINGYPVTAVADWAFAFNSDLRSITLPNSVTSLGLSAFRGCPALRRVVLSSNLTELPSDVFSGCRLLETMSLPEGLTALRAGSLSGCAFTHLILPSSMTIIDSTALRGCSRLATIEVAEGNRFFEDRDGVLYDTADGILVKYPAARTGTSYTVGNAWSVGAWAFEGATGLTEIILSSDVYSLGEGAFSLCSNLSSFPVLGAMVTRIPDSCFDGCTNLNSVVIPGTIRQIGSRAFLNTGLSELQVPDTVTSIMDQAIDSTVLLRCSSGSAAHDWALVHQMPFLLTDNVAVESISFTGDTITLKRGQKTTLSPVLQPADADASGLRYSTFDASVVQIDDGGTLNAIGGGSTLVLVSAPGGASAMLTVNVDVDVEEILLSLASSGLTVGDTSSFTVSFSPQKVTNRTLVWTSSAPSTIAVDENGALVAISDGSAVIRAQSVNGVYAEWTVTVRNPESTFILPAALQSIDEEAFAETNMVYVIIQENCRTISDLAFANSSVRLIRIPASVQTIAPDAFYNCPNITIIGSKTSRAREFAEEHSLRFIPFD